MKYNNVLVNLSICVFLLAALVVSGCGQPKVGGKVVFSDDKTPLSQGVVMFYGDNAVYRGNIKQDGTYTIGTQKANDGLPPGDYTVVLRETAKQTSSGNDGLPTFEAVTDPKYENVETTDLKISVKGSQTFDIEVDRFNDKK